MSLGSPLVAPALEGVSAPGVDCLSADALMCLAQFRAEPKADRYAHGLIAQAESTCCCQQSCSVILPGARKLQ